MEAILANFSLSILDLKLICLGTAGTFIFSWVAGKTLFAPHLALIERREALTEGALENADRLAEESRHIEEQIASAVSELREELHAQRTEKVRQLSKKLEGLFQAQQAEAVKNLEAGRARNAQELKELSDELQRSIPDLVALTKSTALQNFN